MIMTHNFDDNEKIIDYGSYLLLENIKQLRINVFEQIKQQKVLSDMATCV